jgi:hypothetical protein
MRIRSASALVAGLVLWTAPGLISQSSSSSRQAWNLPQGTIVKDSGPRTYRFIVEYNTANTKGEIVFRQRVTGEYTRGLAGGEVMWNNVAQADASGATAQFSAAEKRDFMEGFRYHNDLLSTMKPEFFKGFPPAAVAERNLVWDTGMIEMFGQSYFDHLRLNEPYHSHSDEGVHLPGVGTFHNRDVVLEWVGSSERNGQECALIKYQAFFNPLEIVNGGMTLTGRSDYWGEIWVSLATKQIEYGTLYESVVGEIKLPGHDTTQMVNIFRNGIFEPTDTK